MKKEDKLRVYWNKKEKDLEFWYPYGINSKQDGAYLCFEVFNKKFIEEIEKRGYDITSLKFEICPKLPNETYFPTLTKINNKIN